MGHHSNYKLSEKVCPNCGMSIKFHLDGDTVWYGMIMGSYHVSWWFYPHRPPNAAVRPYPITPENKDDKYVIEFKSLLPFDITLDRLETLLLLK